MEKKNGLLYPMMVIAAISVILFSMVGIAMMTGHMPSAFSQKSDAMVEGQGNKDQIAGKEADITPLADVAKSRAEKDKVRASSNIPVSEQQSNHGRNSQGYQKAAMTCINCGIVESVQAHEVKGSGTGLGVVSGAVVGGVLGHQVGAGRGNDLATVAGAVGGGYLGNEIERNAKKSARYIIRVRMEDGTYRTITQSTQPDTAAGDRVRIENGAVIARG